MKNSIQNYIMKRLFVTFIPIAFIIIYLLFVMKWQNDKYGSIVKNISIATEFNFKFKENVDHKMYRVVIGADTIENQNPYEDLEYANKIFEKLLETNNKDEGINRPKGLIILLNLLKKQIDNIGKSDIYKDYNKNIDSLEYDIRVTTELIEDTVNDYIYEETKELNIVSIKIRNQMAVIFMLSIISVLLILYFTLYMYKKVSRHIAAPIINLCNYTKRSENDLLENNPESSILEIDELSENFNDKIIRIKELIENIKTEQKNKKNTELWLLQSQINPHFLYNALDSINWRAKAIGANVISSMIEALGILLRASMSQQKNLISIKEDLDVVHSYITIQKIRFDEERLCYKESLPEDIFIASIPKMSIQPLVDNAINYAMEYIIDQCVIEVSGYIKNDIIHILITNNGSQFEDDLLDKLRNGTVKAHGIGIGLLNIDQRIKLIFGNDFGLSLYNPDDDHATAELIFPRRTEC